MKIYDVAIVGAGASGMVCAMEAKRRGKKVLLLDGNASALKKVLISGGGRCNFTNLDLSERNYVSADAGFCRKALEEFSSQDFVKLMKKHNLGMVKKEGTQLFCREGAVGIVKMLEKETLEVEKRFKIEILGIEKADNFEIKTNQGSFVTANLVVATGGMSFPQIGASDLGYKIAKQFGLKIVPVRPALAAYNLDVNDLREIAKLKGISLKTKIKCNKFDEAGDLLFTHFGLSGPGILQSSLYWNNGDEVMIDFAPDVDFAKLLKEKRENSKGVKISSVVGKFFPAAMVDFFLNGEKDVFVSEISNKMIANLATRINAWKVKPVSNRGFKAAEVTLGGVDTKEINPQTMESLKVKGLYFVGEVLDVTGQLGGYNLQWAWSSGYCCGKYI